MPRSNPRVLGLFARPDLSAKRDFLLGVARAARAHEDCEIVMLAPVDRLAPFALPPQLDGVIAWPDLPEELPSLRGIPAPLVFMGHIDPGPGFTRVRIDNLAIGRLAADHFLARGFRRFAACMLRADYPYGRDRLAGYTARLAETEEAGPPEIFRLKDNEIAGGEVARIETWLRALPGPTAVYCDTDRAGSLLLRLCQHLGVKVPDQVAVLATGDDDLLCALTHPPLSSIGVRAADAGRLAFELIEARWRRPSTRPAVHPLGDFRVTERASTELLAVEDRAAAAALRLIRERACNGVSVDELARAAGLSRRMLELRFKAATGGTIHAEITRVRLARAQALLAESDLLVAEIAERCGYGEPQRLCEAFARAGLPSPKAWRAARRAGATQGSLTTRKKRRSPVSGAS
jgi:LacI family transcriptional regulator